MQRIQRLVRLNRQFDNGHTHARTRSPLFAAALLAVLAAAGREVEGRGQEVVRRLLNTLEGDSV